MLAAVAAAATPKASAPKISIKPDPGSLPGSPQLQQLLNGLAFWALLAAVAGIVIGAAIWGVASHSNNHHWSARGRSGALVSFFAAIVIGAAAAIINFAVDLGSQVQ